MKDTRISLRQVELSDTSALNSLASGFYKISRFPFAPGKAEEWFADMRESSSECFFVISANKEGGAAWTVGLCGLTQIDWAARRAQIFFAMIDKAKYKATIQDSESTKAALSNLLAHAFKRMGLNKLEIEVSDNNPSLSALEAAGFVVDGVAKDAEFLDGGLRQALVLSILSAEYGKENARHSS